MRLSSSIMYCCWCCCWCCCCCCCRCCRSCCSDWYEPVRCSFRYLKITQHRQKDGRTKPFIEMCIHIWVKQVEQSSDNRCVLANCPRTGLWIVFQMPYFHVPDAILFKFGPFLGNSTRVWRTDGPTDGRTDRPTDGPTDGWTDWRMDGRTVRTTDGRTYPLIEMRERI